MEGIAMNKFCISSLIGLLFTIAGCVKNNSMDIPAVTGFAPEKYLGKWYEYARLPNSFETGLSDCYAVYSPRKDGNISVLNCGRKNGKLHCVNAVAKSVIPGTGELEVSFFRPFYSRYRIIKITPDYSLAAVTGSSRNYLWILSRTKKPDTNSLREFMDFLKQNRYPVEKLIYPQSTP